MPIHATTEEILEAFRTLTSSEYEALAGAAAFLMRGSRFTEPADLISETLHGLLEGRRNWPKKMEFGPFMFATMRSVADSDRQLHENRRVISGSLEDIYGTYSMDESMRSPSVEEQLLAAEPSRLMAHAAMAASIELDGDDDAKHVLASILEGMSRDQACKSFDIAPSVYDNARKRAYRKIRKCIGPQMH
jgi:DNA-directed RNA polymerase specialized sigma24 family protein